MGPLMILNFLYVLALFLSWMAVSADQVVSTRYYLSPSSQFRFETVLSAHRNFPSNSDFSPHGTFPPLLFNIPLRFPLSLLFNH